MPMRVRVPPPAYGVHFGARGRLLQGNAPAMSVNGGRRGGEAYRKCSTNERAAGMNPGYEIRDGHQRVKRLNNDVAPKKVVLISTCGLYEMDSFDALTHFMQAFAKDADFNLVQLSCDLMRMSFEVLV